MNTTLYYMYRRFLQFLKAFCTGVSIRLRLALTAWTAFLADIVGRLESQYGPAGRIWVMDRRIVSEENLEYLRERGQRYIVVTPKSHLKRFEKEMLSQEWRSANGA